MFHIPHKKVFLIILTFVGFFVVLLFLNLFDKTRNTNMVYGISFDPQYATYLGLNPMESYKTLVDDWKFKHVRLSVHWDSLEKNPGLFDFSEVDTYVNESVRAGVKVILAVGNKTPRWPECHVPYWAKKLKGDDYQKALNNYLTTVVERYRNSSALEIWQVENEPFLDFGETCVGLTPDQLKSEVALVKSLDPNHPTMVSDTGELGFWFKTGRAADLFGTTMYRVVWSEYFGYWNYDWLPPSFYRMKFKLVGRDIQKAYIVELQGESWAPAMPIVDVPMEVQKKSMDIVRLKKNLDFAARVGTPRAYLWGSEWWLWLKKNGYNEIPDFVSKLNK